MLKKYFFIVAILAFALPMFAQDDAETTAENTEEEPKFWTKKASFGLNLTSVGLSNWAGGGENSFSIAGLVKANATYKKNNVTWLNDLEMGYGVVKQGDITEFRKSDDRLIFISKWSKSFGESDWAYTFLADFRTQMTDGLDYSTDDLGVESESIISRLMAPGYLTLAVGAEYKPNDNFYVMASPLSGKLTFVMDETLSDLAAFGVDTGKTVRAELGAIFNMSYSKELMKNIKYSTKLNLFQSYEKGAKLDILWDNLLELKVNDYISSTVSTQLIYDHDVKFTNDDGTQEDRVQFKYVFNVGFLINF